MKVFVDSRSFGTKCDEAVDIVEEVATLERTEESLSEDELAETLTDYDGVIVGTGEITKKVVEASDELKVVAKHGVGLDNIDLHACTENGVVVTYVPGVNAESVADFAFCLMLALARKLIPAHILTKQGKWESKKFMGAEIYEKTLGIIGFGNVGRRVAKRAKGFDMETLCTEKYQEKYQEEAEELGVEFTELETLLEESDIVTIHCPLTEETEGMIGKEELSKMKDSSFLINTSRGPIVDEEAVYEALRDEEIKGAAFDVYAEEPPSESCPLFDLNNVVVAPHIASYTIDAIKKVDLTQARDVVKALKGEKPELVANPEVFE